MPTVDRTLSSHLGVIFGCAACSCSGPVIASICLSGSSDTFVFCLCPHAIPKLASGIVTSGDEHGHSSGLFDQVRLCGGRR